MSGFQKDSFEFIQKRHVKVRIYLTLEEMNASILHQVYFKAKASYNETIVWQIFLSLNATKVLSYQHSTTLHDTTRHLQSST